MIGITANMAAANPCGVLQGLANYQFQVLKSLNKKFAALQRLADLLEQVADISSLLPNIGQLIPVISINFDTYTEVQVACPFLNLPPFSNESLAALQAQVTTAYGLLLRQILNHPLLRMNRVQDMLNDFQNQINFPYGSNYLACLNNICSAIGVAGSVLSGISAANVASELSSFSANFVQNGGVVLRASQQTKVNEAVNTYNQVLNLRDDSIQDFRSISVGGVINPQPPPLHESTPSKPNFEFLPNGTVRFPSD